MTPYLGLDLGGTEIKGVLVEQDRILASCTMPTGTDGPEDVLERVVDLGRSLAREHGVPAAAGLGLPGHFDPASGTGVLLPNLPGDWVGVPIAAPVAAGLGVDVELINDVRAMTLAELDMGAGRGARDLICIALGTGVGGGVVIDGRLHLGLGHAGEIGHVTVVPDGPECGCGNRGCLDRVAGAATIAREAGHPTVADAVLAARNGDRRAAEALSRAGRHVGIALAAAIVLLWPERVIVGGGVSKAGDLILDPLREEIQRRACVAPLDRLEIVSAALGPTAGAVGAALWSRDPGRHQSDASLSR